MTSRSKKTATRKLATPDGKDRSKYLGGSDAAAALGVSPWRSAYRLWCEKIGEDRGPDLSLRPWIEWGNRLEPVVADAFSDRMKMKVEPAPEFLTHVGYPFMGGHLDRFVLLPGGRRSFLECKTTNAYDNRMWGDEDEGVAGVPAHYVAQCDHYLAITNFEFCFVAVLIGGNDFRVYRIARSQVREQRLLRAEKHLWNLVLTETPPPVTTEEDARMRWKQSVEGTSVDVEQAVYERVRTLSLISDREKAASAEVKRIRNELFPLFGEAEALSFNGNLIARLTNYERNAFDSEKFAKKYPKLVKKFTKTVPAKRFKVLI